MSFAEIADDSDEDERQSMSEESTKDETLESLAPPMMNATSGDVRKTEGGSPKSRRTLAPQWSRTGGSGAQPLRLILRRKSSLHQY